MPKHRLAGEAGAVTRSQARAMRHETACGEIGGNDVAILGEVSRDEKDAMGWKNAINIDSEPEPYESNEQGTYKSTDAMGLVEYVDLVDSDDEHSSVLASNAPISPVARIGPIRLGPVYVA